MWQRLTNPDILIYLDASYAITLVRRNLNWTQQEYAQQVERLAHARANADILVETDDLTPEQVCQEVQKRILALTSRPE
jgi:cytidylate kinase